LKPGGSAAKELLMPRPISVKPDETVLWDLAFLGLSDQHIAKVIGCHQSLISRRSDLRRTIAQARDEQAEAIVAAWKCSSQGSLRPEGRPEQLVQMVWAARQWKIRRKRPEQRKISEELRGDEAKGPALPAGKERQSQG